MSQTYNTANIRALLLKGFSDQELRRFCFDQPDFRPVFDQLAQNTLKDSIIDRILEYADQQDKVGALLAWAKGQNPARYSQYQPYTATAPAEPDGGQGEAPMNSEPVVEPPPGSKVAPDPAKAANFVQPAWSPNVVYQVTGDLIQNFEYAGKIDQQPEPVPSPEGPVTPGGEEVIRQLDWIYPRVTPWKTPRSWPQPLPDDTMLGRVLLYDPFEHETTENDFDFLFGEAGGFWGDHRCCTQIADNKPQVVYGADGCGKTALARALIETDNPEVASKILPVYISGQPEVIDLQQAVAKALLQYICAAPFTLGRVGNYNQDQLAYHLCTGLGYNRVRAAIEQALDLLARATGQDLTPEQKVYMGGQLKRFTQFLKEDILASLIDVKTWLPQVETAVTGLGLDFIMMSIDPESGSRLSYVRAIFNQLRHWEEHRIVIKWFLSKKIGQQLAGKQSGINFQELTWSDSDIEALAHWRFDAAARLAGLKMKLENVFDPDTFPDFIRYAQGREDGPRRLAGLWRSMFTEYRRSSPDRRTFSRDNLVQAMEKLT